MLKHAIAALCIGAVCAMGHAATLTLEANARARASNDEMSVTLAAEREGTDLASMNQQVLSALNAAVEEARKVRGVQARLGSITTQQNWSSQGRPTGWKVRGDLVLTSQNLPELGKLAGDLSQRLMFSSVMFRLSDAARTALEKRLISEAATAFRDKAKDASAALGFSGYTIKDVQLFNTSQGGRPPPMPRMRASEAMVASAPVPTESGESEVVVGFSGTIELK